MWRELEEDAIYIGLDINYFWSLNPKQFNKYVKVFNKKVNEKAKEKDRFNYMLGQYITYAFNDPKHYPRKPFMENMIEEEQKDMTAEEMEKMAKYNTIKKGGQVKWN